MPDGGPVLAVDGGASKTDVALVTAAGEVLAALRLPLSSHLGVGREAAIETLRAAVAATARQAGRASTPLASLGVFCLAGVDLPVDERRIQKLLAGWGWSATTLVRNDTFAVLRAGSRRGWGVAVVCGAGMNCVGVGPDGRVVRFPALGELSGDLASGGGWLGVAAVGAAMRARDGRGGRTELERLVAAHFGMRGPTAVMEALYLGKLPMERTLELAPLVFTAARGGDRVARHLLDQLADEVIAMVTATLRRLRLGRQEVEVVLGGGIFRSRDEVFMERITAAVTAAAPRALVSALAAPPLLGAVLLGLDQLGASSAGKERARRALTHEALQGGLIPAAEQDGHRAAAQLVEEGGKAWRA